MEEQRGIAPHFFAEAAITSAIDANGVGKAVVYGTSARKVLEGTEALATDFAGVISTVDSEATVTRTNALVNQGSFNVAEGDILGLVNDHIVKVRVSGAVGYKKYITLDDGGLFKEHTLSATPTAEEVLKICGRALEAADEAGSITAMIWVRK